MLAPESVTCFVHVRAEQADIRKKRVSYVPPSGSHPSLDSQGKTNGGIAPHAISKLAIRLQGVGVVGVVGVVVVVVMMVAPEPEAKLFKVYAEMAVWIGSLIVPLTVRKKVMNFVASTDAAFDT
jgi:hypothetical protein